MDEYKKRLIDDLVSIARRNYPDQSKRTVDTLLHGSAELLDRWDAAVITPLIEKHGRPEPFSRQYHLMIDAIIHGLNSQGKLSESASKTQLLSQFKEFLLFCLKELEIKQLPKITWFTHDDVGGGHHSFGSFHNEDQTIRIGINNRHPLDIMRTLAHELCHYKQWTEDQLHDKSGETGSPQENEANARAGVIMRDWNQAHPEMFKQSPIMENYDKPATKTKRILKYGIMPDGPLEITDHFLDRVDERGLDRARMGRLIVLAAKKNKEAIAAMGPDAFAFIYRDEPGGIAIKKVEQIDGSFKYYIITVHEALKVGPGQTVFRI